MRALNLPDILRAAGLTVVEVPGWRTRGKELAAIRGGVAHHTATAQSAGGDYPTLAVVRDGRTGIPGPLAQLGLGRSGTWYVIASGRANHAGVVHARYAGTHANSCSLGVEAEHPGGRAPWPAAQYASYVRGCAALARAYGITWLGHKEVAAPAGRKTDPSFDMAAFRSALTAQEVGNVTPAPGGIPGVPSFPQPTPIEEMDDMFSDDDRRLMKQTLALLQEQQKRNSGREDGNVPRGVAEEVWKYAAVPGGAYTQPTSMIRLLGDIGTAARAAAAATSGLASSGQVDAAALAESIADALGPDLAQQVADEIGRRLAHG